MMKLKPWWLINSILGGFLFIGIVLILVRKVDGAGYTETPASRLLAIAVLVGFALLIVICEAVGFLIHKRFK